ncbi:MAG TPA: AAA family ATPase [Anaerolineales bacterium]|nr:AAA family ATPase [Anaerolineales bacterium]HNQ94575.1 AAA family ATPase [Anaerolineales bacterium]HNS62260.1 AAA family ATPase [Anaerolineales bacterium]
MKVALTESFLDDLTELPVGIKHKGLELLSALRQIEPRNLREQVLPGWRLHKLQSSPFISLSLDMNYRVLAKIEGETVFLYRAVKHSLADSPKVNRNDALETPYSITGDEVKPSDIYAILGATGFLKEQIQIFKDVQTEDDLLDKLGELDSTIADYVLAIYETAGMVIPRTRFSFFQTDHELESLFEKNQYDWDLYLHPSQKYLAELPVGTRVAVSGSAGTGKTVCAWYRLQHLATHREHKVGFVAPNKSALEVSQEKIQKLLAASNVDSYFLVPKEPEHLIQLAESVEHIIIDEGQEISPLWYKKLGESLKNLTTGLTLFYDLNQLGGNYQTGDTKRYAHRLSDWSPAITSIPKCNLIQFFINYRNSKEIAEYYFQQLEATLPNSIQSEIPVFSSGEVLKFEARNDYQVYATIENIIRKLFKEYSNNEIGIVTSGSAPSASAIQEHLERINIPTTTDLNSKDKILVSVPSLIRGHEKKVIVVCKGESKLKMGRAIESYIAFSRARERLLVIEVQG